MARKRTLLGVGLGAGLAGAVVLALKYAVRRPTLTPVPDSISPAIFATKVLHTSAGAMIYHESGTGQPLLFVHSVWPGASSYEWSKIYPHFAVSHRVLAPDLVGFGESARPEAGMSAADQARTLAEFLRAASDEPAIVIGSGLGGGFAALLASQHPDLVERLVLVSPTGLREFGRQRIGLRTRLASRTPLISRFLYRNHQATAAAIRAMLAKFCFASPERVTDEMVDVFTTCAQQKGAEHAIRSLQSGRFAIDLENRLSTLTQTVHFIWGERSLFPPVEWAERLASIPKSSSLAILPDVGTMAPLEAPERTTEILNEILGPSFRVVRSA
jgi:pimeloyl-ACP methyl ester carboxylesterase